MKAVRFYTWWDYLRMYETQARIHGGGESPLPKLEKSEKKEGKGEKKEGKGEKKEKRGKKGEKRGKRGEKRGKRPGLAP